MMRWASAVALLVAAAPTQADAQARARDLQVSASEAWKHPASNLLLPAQIAGYKRTTIVDNSDEELDLIAQYQGPEGAVATVYIYRSQLPVVPLWFDRARTVLEQLRLRGNETSAPAASADFVLPGQSAVSGMRATYSFAQGDFRSTGVALASANGWLVKVRMSSRAEPLQLDSKLGDFVNAIRWPAAPATSPTAGPIARCSDKLALAKAKMIKPDMAQAMLGSIVAMAGSMKGLDTTGRYCREADAGILYGVYRVEGSRDSYLMAIADSGRLLSVGRQEPLDGKGKATYAVSLLDLGRTSVYPAFDKLPEPAQVMQMIQAQAPLSSAKLGTATIELNAPR